MAWPVSMFRLVSTPAEPGLYCGKDGLTLGGVPLLEHDTGFAPRSADALDRIFDAAYGVDSGIDAASRLSGLQSVARALNENDLSRAIIISLMLKLPDIDNGGTARLNEFAVTLKFDDTEARNWRGRWTAGGAGNPNVTPVQLAPPFPVISPPIPGTYGAPKPKDDDIFPIIPSVNAGQPATSDSLTDTHAVANDNTPQVCPEPSWEPSSVQRTREQLLYQAQINKLPIGWHVLVNGVGYDGCRESDQTLLEGKFKNAWFLTVPEFLRPHFDEYIGTMAQAYRQNYYSGGRKVEWHYSNESISKYWDSEFKKAGYSNITVKFTPYDEEYNHNLIRYEKIRS